LLAIPEKRLAGSPWRDKQDERQKFEEVLFRYAGVPLPDDYGEELTPIEEYRRDMKLRRKYYTGAEELS
jgi:hypothetical protein